MGRGGDAGSEEDRTAGHPAASTSAAGAAYVAGIAPDQVWALDVRYLLMARGFVCLVALLGGRSRKVLAWRASITLDTTFCVEAGEKVRGRWLGNVLIARLRKAVRGGVSAGLRVRVGRKDLAGDAFDFCSARRPDTSLARRTPDQIYFPALPLPKAA